MTNPPRLCRLTAKTTGFGAFASVSRSAVLPGVPLSLRSPCGLQCGLHCEPERGLSSAVPNDRGAWASARQADLGVGVPLLVVVGDLERPAGQVRLAGIEVVLTAHGQASRPNTGRTITLRLRGPGRIANRSTVASVGQPAENSPDHFTRPMGRLVPLETWRLTRPIHDAKSSIERLSASINDSRSPSYSPP